MHVHFVSDGNVFRSRIAEAILQSKIDGTTTFVTTSSSGVRAGYNLEGSIAWYTQRILQKNNLTAYTSPSWTQTSKKLLKQADLNIFFSEEPFAYCTKVLDYEERTYEIWRIPDLRSSLEAMRHLKVPVPPDEDTGVLSTAEETFHAIAQRIEQLYARFTRPWEFEERIVHERKTGSST